MKKILLVLTVALLLLCLVGCNANGFMSASKVNKLTSEFGTPQAELSIKYTVNKQEMELRITYNILLDKTPIAAISFINLVNDGFYNDAVLETYDSRLNYIVGARYKYTSVDEGKTYKYIQNVKTEPFAGEFASNGYRAPKSGYAEFKKLSLAMYHDGTADDFNQGNGALIIATSSNTLKSSNYAVFAEMVELQLYKDGSFSQRYDVQHLPDDVINPLRVSSTSRSVTMLDGSTASKNILGGSNITRFVLSAKMLTEADWSKLPKVN